MPVRLRLQTYARSVRRVGSLGFLGKQHQASAAALIARGDLHPALVRLRYSLAPSATSKAPSCHATSCLRHADGTVISGARGKCDGRPFSMVHLSIFPLPSPETQGLLVKMAVLKGLLTAAILPLLSLSQFVPAPTDLTCSTGYLDLPVRWKEVPDGICELTPGVKSYSGYVDIEENQVRVALHRRSRSSI